MSSSNVIWLVLLCALTLGLFALPLLPAWIELGKVKGTQPLFIDAEDNGTAQYAALSNGQLAPELPNAVAFDAESQAQNGKKLLFKWVALAKNKVIPTVIASEKMVCVHEGCVFNWLDAPQIYFGDINDSKGQEGPSFHTHYSNTAHGDRIVAGENIFKRHEGDMLIPPATHLKGDYVVTGRLKLGEGAHVQGSVKAYGSVLLSRRASISGSLFTQGNAQLAEESRVASVVSAAGSVTLRAGSVVGSYLQPATVAASTLVAHSGARVYGSVHAQHGGIVVA